MDRTLIDTPDVTTTILDHIDQEDYSGQNPRHYFYLSAPRWGRRRIASVDAIGLTWTTLERHDLSIEGRQGIQTRSRALRSILS